MSRALSFYQEGNSLKAALLRKEKQGLFIETLKTILIDDDVKPLYILDSILQQKSYHLVTALDPSKVLFRKIHLPIADKEKALSALAFQLEDLLPFSPQETLLAPLLKKVGKAAISAILFATKESSLVEHLSWAKDLGLDPDLVTCAPIALYRLAKWLFPKEENACLFYWGETKSFCLCLRGGEIFLTHVLHFGNADFFAALQQDFPKMSVQELQTQAQDSNGLLNDPPCHYARFRQEIAQELARLSVFLNHKQAVSNESKWLLLGDGKAAFDLQGLFCETLSPHLLPAISAEIQNYALPIGLALNALANDDHSLQLLQGEWTPKHLIQKRKRFCTIYTLLCAALAFLLSFSCHGILHKKEKLLAQRLEDHLPPSISKEDLVSEEVIRLKVWEWEKSLASQKLSFPFISPAPTVSDVLAWLSTHPVLNDPEGGKREELEIKSVRYQLYKYPKLGESKDPYLARVELEFTSTAPRIAREFHDALLKGDRLVNAKKEIKWISQNGTYFTSFELQPLKKGGE